MKQCTRCGRTKETTQFARDKQKRDGLRNWCRECVREHRQLNAESIRESRSRYNASTREDQLRKSREYHDAHRDEILERKRAYDSRNRDRTSARIADYYRVHPEKRWVNAYQSRAKAYGLIPVVESFTKQDVLDRYGDCCHYCEGGVFEELDHYTPVAAGGHHSLDNVRPSCSNCNNEKSMSDRLAAREFRLVNA